MEGSFLRPLVGVGEPAVLVGCLPLAVPGLCSLLENVGDWLDLTGDHFR